MPATGASVSGRVSGLCWWLVLAASVLVALGLPAPLRAEDGDIALYREIAGRVERGDGYYAAAAELHRQENYPLRPFVTVRSPVLAHGHALIGGAGMLLTAWLILGMALVAWSRTLRDRPPAERAAVLAVIAAGGAALISPEVLHVHELWAGLLITLALGLGWNRRLQLVAALCAVLLRELAAPILILLLFPFERRQFVRVGIAIGIVAAFYAWHAANVASVVQPGDPSSQGWFGLMGPAGLATYLSASAGREIPVWAAFLPLAGWMMHGDRLVFPWCAGVAGAIAIIARPDNLFWLLMFCPLYPAGLVFLVSAAILAVRRLRPARWMSVRMGQPS